MFTSLSVQDTTDCMLDVIYVYKEIKALCNNSIFKKLLLKLTKEFVFSVKNKRKKQTDGCIIVGSTTIVYSDIYVS